MWEKNIIYAECRFNRHEKMCFSVYIREKNVVLNLLVWKIFVTYLGKK